MDIIKNFNKVKEEIAIAAAKSNRCGSDISLIVVSKNQSVEKIRPIVEENHFILGENRVQELLDKYEQLPPEVEWHLIGHLQRNKVKYITDKVKLIHSLDSLQLAAEINKRMEKTNKVMNCLIQVNVAQEESKFGISVGELFSFVEEVAKFKNLKIKGLMTIAPEVENPEDVRPVFRELKGLFDNLKDVHIPSVDIEYLSMGMTNDYKVAIEEGANIVRIGSAIFGPRY